MKSVRPTSHQIEIVRVVHDAHLVGFGVANAKLDVVVQQRAASAQSRISWSRGEDRWDAIVCKATRRRR